MSNNQYKVILADCPWSYRDTLDPSRTLPYPTMDMRDIIAMPVRELAAPNCVLFLWVTGPQLEDIFIQRLIGHWGFHFVTVAFVWIKLSKKATPVYGMGNWSRQNAEYVLLATRGEPERASAAVSQVIITNEDSESIEIDQVVFAPRAEHSEKPLEVHRRIEQLMGEQRTPRLELFARASQKGWDVAGFDINGEDFNISVCGVPVKKPTAGSLFE